MSESVITQLDTRIIIKNDSSVNWLTNKSHVLLKGETAYEFCEDGNVKQKVGDGVKTWEELDYFGGEENTFDEDLTLTYAFGKYEPDETGSVVVPAAGKTMKELILDAFSEEVYPTLDTATKPSITLSNVGEFKAYEVGTKVTPSYTISFNAGSYAYGPATGITATGYSATFNGETLTTASGDFAELTVADGTNIRMSAYAKYGDGAVPVTNLGNDYADGQIKAGQTETKYSGYLTGYRNTFHGTLAEKSTVDSAAIRKLTASGKALSNGSKFDVTIPVGALRVVIAYPATLRDVTSIQDNNDSMSNIVSSFTKTTVSVEGANGATAIDYKVYTMDFAKANDKANTFSVTI